MKINIMGLEFTVKYDTIDCHGETFLDKKLIKLNPDYSKESQDFTIFHELFHIILDEFNPSLIDIIKSCNDNSHAEHALIDAITPILVKMLKDNPKLVEQLYAN